MTADDRTTAMLAAPWKAVPNDEIGGWAVTTDGRTPAAGVVMAADMVWSREIAERIAADHNDLASMRAALAAEAASLEQDGGMVSAHWVASHLRFIAEAARRWPKPGEGPHIVNTLAGPLCASTTAEPGAGVPEYTPNPAQAATADRDNTEEQP